MKATGIVRRIDDLGRVVIPKEIRRTLHIREGDPLEIYTDKDGGVIFRKYSPLGELGNFAGDCCSALYSVSGINCAVCDTDSVIAFSGQGKNGVIEKSISPDCQALIDMRKSYFSNGSSPIHITDPSSPVIVAAAPVFAEGDIAGMIAFLETDGKKPAVSEEKLLAASALFLGKQLEN